MKGSQIVIISLLMAISIFFFKNNIFEEGEYVARVVAVDNSKLIQRGLSRIGAQSLEIDVLSGDMKGENLQIINRLNGSPEYDEYYQVKNKILIKVSQTNGKPIVMPVSLYRAPTLFLSLIHI